MKGTVKWFNDVKGYGFITDESGKDVFVHYSSIHMDGRKSLHEDDIVEFEIGEGTNGREQAVNVQPILTMQMIKEALNNEGYRVKHVEDQYRLKQYFVINCDDISQSPEYGMTFEELAAYAGFSVSEE